jgi:Methyltransferase domain
LVMPFTPFGSPKPRCGCFRNWASAAQDKPPSTLEPTATPTNPIDQSDFFVRQQYLDLVDRVPTRAGCGYLVTLVKNSLLQCLAGCTDCFDLVFLDGENTAANVYQEMSLALKVLNKDGVILLHDYFPKNRALSAGNSPRVGPYIPLSRVRKKSPQIKVISLGELPWPTKLGTSKTTLALVMRL